MSSDDRFEEPAPPARPYRTPDPTIPNPKGKPTPKEVDEHLREYRRRMGIPDPPEERNP